MRIALGVEYDGSEFAGWQRQGHARTVQETVERALSKVADHAVAVTCAGRTDAGVHAYGQVIHFDTTAQRTPFAWVMGTNANMPGDVSVRWAKGVEGSFNARFSAYARRYRYVILDRPIRPALNRRRVGWTFKPLNAEAMRAACPYLLGEHDFSSFRAAACQARHAIREVQYLDVGRTGDYLYVDVQANAFLHHMVRNIAGVLMSIGAGEKPPRWARDVLRARDRRAAAATAAPHGLYLVAVLYPEHFALPANVETPVFA